MNLQTLQKKIRHVFPLALDSKALGNFHPVAQLW